MAKLAPKDNKHVLVFGHVENSGGIVIRGKSYEIREVWHSVLNPQAPPVVVVRKIDKEAGT